MDYDNIFNIRSVVSQSVNGFTGCHVAVNHENDTCFGIGLVMGSAVEIMLFKTTGHPSQRQDYRL